VGDVLWGTIAKRLDECERPRNKDCIGNCSVRARGWAADNQKVTSHEVKDTSTVPEGQKSKVIEQRDGNHKTKLMQ
jgi:hypothetical protein